MAAENVLSGGAPLTRSQNSGGISEQMSPMESLFGKKGYITAIGGSAGTKPVRADIFFNKYFLSISNPLNQLASDFRQYFILMKDNIRAQAKEKGGGIIKTLHSFAPHFFDFTIWKRLTGQARDPQIAALHQIRDILIKVHDLDKVTFGRDPRDVVTEVFNQFKFFRQRLAPDEQSLLPAIWKTSVGFFKEALSESREEDKQFYEKRFGKSDAGKGIEELVTTSKEQLELNKKVDEREEFQERTSKKGDKSVGSGIIAFLKKMFPWAMLTAGLGLLFGKKGIIAGAAAAFFVTVLPKLLLSGVSALFNLSINLAGTILSKGFGLLKFLVTNPGAIIGAGKTALGVAGGLGLFIGTTLHDVFKKGGAKDLWKQGKKGESISTALTGSDMKEMSGPKLAGNLVKQTVKYAGLGMIIGSIFPVVGAVIGGAIGGAVGFIVTGIKALWQKGIITKMWNMIKANLVGSILGGVIGTLLFPGVGTVLGILGGAFAEKKIKASKTGQSIGKKLGDTFASVTDKIHGFIGASWDSFKGKFPNAADYLEKHKSGATIGAILGSVIPGIGTLIGAFGGALVEDKIVDSKLAGKLKQFFSDLFTSDDEKLMRSLEQQTGIKRKNTYKDMSDRSLEELKKLSKYQLRSLSPKEKMTWKNYLSSELGKKNLDAEKKLLTTQGTVPDTLVTQESLLDHTKKNGNILQKIFDQDRQIAIKSGILDGLGKLLDGIIWVGDTLKDKKFQIFEQKVSSKKPILKEGYNPG